MYHRHRKTVWISVRVVAADPWSSMDLQHVVRVTLFRCFSASQVAHRSDLWHEYGGGEGLSTGLDIVKLDPGLENKSHEIWLSANLSAVYADGLDKSVSGTYAKPRILRSFIVYYSCPVEYTAHVDITWLLTLQKQLQSTSSAIVWCSTEFFYSRPAPAYLISQGGSQTAFGCMLVVPSIRKVYAGANSNLRCESLLKCRMPSKVKKKKKGYSPLIWFEHQAAV